MTFKVLADNKEKIPWDLSFYGLEQERVHLATADYTIEGYEDDVAIERKKSIAEVALNLGKEAKRFKAELLRLEDFRFRYLICEFTSQQLAQFPKGAGIPKFLRRKVRIRGKYLIKTLVELCDDHGIELIFAGTRKRAEEEAIRVLTEAYEILNGES